MHSKKQNDTCIIWLTHRLDERALNEYIRLKAECGDKYDTLVLYDNSRQDFSVPGEHADTRFSLFELDDLKRKYRLYPFQKQTGITPGNTAFPLLDFALQHHYSNYWQVEYDVRYTGNWLEFFSSFDDNSSDLLGSTLYRHAFRPDWCWWSSLKTPLFSLLRSRNRIRGFFPIMRVSAEGLRTYHRANRKGWTGHLEVMLPTVLNHYGLTIEDIGGDGEFVAEENTNRYYTNSPRSDGLVPGTFICPPKKPISEMLPDMLYHAVK